MQIVDISRELFSSPVYPGDPVPKRDLVRQMSLGDSCNLSGFYACCHSATHLDAPLHFIDGGKPIDQTDLRLCFGPCSVVKAEGIITGSDIDSLPERTERRLLLKGSGKAFLSRSAAFALAGAGFLLIGTDAPSIGTPEDEAGPHRELLGAGIPILEGLDLSSAAPGNYCLSAFPLRLGGAEAAPVRAVLFRR